MATVSETTDKLIKISSNDNLTDRARRLLTYAVIAIDAPDQVNAIDTCVKHLAEEGFREDLSMMYYGNDDSWNDESLDEEITNMAWDLLEEAADSVSL